MSNSIYFMDQSIHLINVNESLAHIMNETDINIYNICNLNGSKILFGAHHKTGTVLLNTFIRKRITEYLYKTCNVTYSRTLPIYNILSTNGLSVYEIKEFISSRGFNQDRIIIVNMIRCPIDTILSGYNYHLVESREKWLRQPLNSLLENANNILQYRQRKNLQIINHKQKNLKCNSLIIINKTNILNDTIANLYNKYNTSFGLNLEYNRYLACEYDEIYGSYKLLNDLQQKKNKNIITKNVKLEDFMSDDTYNDNLKTMIFDTLGITNENDILSLTKTLLREKIYNSNRTHTTSGKYDKQQQIHILLSNIHRCNKLKEITILFDYQWKYQQYC